MFSVLTKHQKELLVNALVTHKFQAGKVIVNEGDPGDLFYIIEQGEVVCSV